MYFFAAYVGLLFQEWCQRDFISIFASSFLLSRNLARNSIRNPLPRWLCNLTVDNKYDYFLNILLLRVSFNISSAVLYDRFYDFRPQVFDVSHNQLTDLNDTLNCLPSNFPGHLFVSFQYHYDMSWVLSLPHLFSFSDLARTGEVPPLIYLSLFLSLRSLSHSLSVCNLSRSSLLLDSFSPHPIIFFSLLFPRLSTLLSFSSSPLVSFYLIHHLLSFFHS